MLDLLAGVGLILGFIVGFTLLVGISIAMNKWSKWGTYWIMGSVMGVGILAMLGSAIIHPDQQLPSWEWITAVAGGVPFIAGGIGLDDA